jgi:hypothetical protein
VSNAKTIGELLKRTQASMVKSHKAVVAEEPEADARTEGFALGVAYAASKFEEVLGYHIIPGTDAVVTAEGLEAGGDAVAEALRKLLPGSWETHPRDCDDIAAAAITAAGGIVPDEVVALNGPLLWVKQNGDVVEMGDGDTLYIKRAGTSKDGPGIDRGE